MNVPCRRLDLDRGRQRCLGSAGDSQGSHLQCSGAPLHWRTRAAYQRLCLAASLLQPRFQKVDHQGRDAGSLVDHQMWRATRFYHWSRCWALAAALPAAYPSA